MLRCISSGNGGTRGGTTVTMMPMLPIPTVFLLRSRVTGEALSVSGRPPTSKKRDIKTDWDHNKKYMLGFVQKEDAELVQRGSTFGSNIAFTDEDEMCAMDKAFAVVTMAREVDINELPMFVHESSLQMFLEMPFKSEANIGFVHQLLDVTPDDIVMEVQVLDSIGLSM